MILSCKVSHHVEENTTTAKKEKKKIVFAYSFTTQRPLKEDLILRLDINFHHVYDTVK